MPKRTFLTQEESKLPGHKPMKDRLDEEEEPGEEQLSTTKLKELLEQ